MLQENTKADIRWKQRFENYSKSLVLLLDIINSVEKNIPLSNKDKLSIIKAFEITFELSWNVMKDYLTSMGIVDIIGSKGAIRNAFNQGLISDGQTWMEIVDSRNKTSQAYDEDIAYELAKKITEIHYGKFIEFKEKMEYLQRE